MNEYHELQNYLLDTNSLIYLIDENLEYLEFLKKFSPTNTLCISTITFIEYRMGTEIASKVQHVKNDFRIIDLNLDIADKTTEFLKRIKYKNLKNPGLADIIIAATACVYDMPLITNNPKDYKYFPEVHIMKP